MIKTVTLFSLNTLDTMTLTFSWSDVGVSEHLGEGCDALQQALKALLLLGKHLQHTRIMIIKTFPQERISIVGDHLRDSSWIPSEVLFAGTLTENLLVRSK